MFISFKSCKFSLILWEANYHLNYFSEASSIITIIIFYFILARVSNNYQKYFTHRKTLRKKMNCEERDLQILRIYVYFHWRQSVYQVSADLFAECNWMNFSRWTGTMERYLILCCAIARDARHFKVVAFISSFLMNCSSCSVTNKFYVLLINTLKT